MRGRFGRDTDGTVRCRSCRCGCSCHLGSRLPVRPTRVPASAGSSCVCAPISNGHPLYGDAPRRQHGQTLEKPTRPADGDSEHPVVQRPADVFPRRIRQPGSCTSRPRYPPAGASLFSASGLSRKWWEGIFEPFGVDSQGRTTKAHRQPTFVGCVEAEDAASGVEGRRDPALICETGH